MPDDPFANLGDPSGRRAPSDDEPAAPASPEDAESSPSAAERLAELDSGAQKSAGPWRPDTRRVQRRYTWVVGVAATIVIIVVGVNTLPRAGVGTHGPRPGTPLPRFAAPSAFSGCSSQCDPNVKQGASDRTAPNKTPACEVRGAGVVNSCELVRRPLAITFIGPGTSECDRYLDRIERLMPSFSSVNFAAVVSGRSVRQVAALVRHHGWSFPVAVDRTFAVEDLFHVSVEFCATTTFAYRGGAVRSTAVLAQKLSDDTLRRDISAIAGTR